MATHTAMAQGSDASMRNSLEQRLGIIHFVSTKEHGWSGQSRTRYTDFLVNEITKDGEVVHLSDFHSNSRDLSQAGSQNVPAPSNPAKPTQSNEPKSSVSGETSAVKREELVSEEKAITPVEESSKDSIAESDKNALVDLVGQTTADALTMLYAKILQNPRAGPKGSGDVCIPTIGDKSERSRVHGEVRRIFGGKLDTTTGPDDSIKATASRGGNKQRGNRSGNANTRNSRQNVIQGSSGPYLHFSLYKENKDTMDALNHMAKILRLHPKVFGAAGTKDRRAVTVQRVSIKGRSPNSLIAINERIHNVKIGDFKYEQDPIRLNDHDGNEFVIVLKNCVFSGTENLSFEEKLDMATSTIDSSMKQINQHGFINYYGTQRFGTHQIGTQEIGMKILKSDFAGAVQALLSYDPLLLRDAQDQYYTKGSHKEDISRAQACSTFLETQNAKTALEYLPARCHVEKTVIQHLAKNPTDFLGALMSINRSMRTMYGHAYQSLVWNFVASKRWERFGSQVINGDLVLVKSNSAATMSTNDHDKDTENSLGWAEDIAASLESGFVPHIVTKDDLQDMKYSIYDVVLPSPGWDVTYPPNEIGDFYAEFMGKPENGGLDPHDMRRRQRDFSLPGSYRKLMGKLKRVPTASVQAYSNDLDQLVPTDLDIIRSRKSKEAAQRGTRRRNAATSWQTFTQNIEQNEREESKARVAYRETEDPIPPARVNETWVQTSVDGSNKRIKIAKHTDVCEIAAESMNSESGGLMQVEDGTQGDEQPKLNVGTVVSDGHVVNDEAKEQQLPPESLSSSIITAVTAQVRAIKTIFLKTTRQVMAFLGIITNKTSAKPTQGEHQSQPPPIHGPATTAVSIPQTSAFSSSRPITSIEPNQATPTSHLSNGVQESQLDPVPVVPISTVAADKPNTSQAENMVSTNPINTNKIAVILRFALDTSQYATIVIRELQGAPAMSDDLPHAANSLTPSADTPHSC
ncbi:pseudouridine synthase [Xylaria venustula]|nr:pseudouridine synthase [Xylaria venustula]